MLTSIEKEAVKLTGSFSSKWHSIGAQSIQQGIKVFTYSWQTDTPNSAHHWYWCAASCYKLDLALSVGIWSSEPKRVIQGWQPQQNWSQHHAKIYTNCLQTIFIWSLFCVFLVVSIKYGFQTMENLVCNLCHQNVIRKSGYHPFVFCKASLIFLHDFVLHPVLPTPNQILRWKCLWLLF